MKLFSSFKNQGKKIVKIGNDSYQIAIPEKYDFEYDDEGTLLFYPPGEETITIRVTVLSFERKDGKKAHAVDVVIEDALSKNLDYEMLDKNSVLLEFEPTFAKEDEVDLLMQYWYVGIGNSIIIFSSTTILNMADSNPVVDIKNELPQILKSVTKA